MPLSLLLALLPPVSLPDVVKTADGSVFRGSVVEAGDALRVRTERGERRLRRGEVVAVLREEDLRAEVTRLLADSEAAGPLRLAQVALWCFRNGLHEEGFRNLDRAVAIEPSTPAIALAVREGAARLRDDLEEGEEGVIRLVRLGAGRSASRRLTAESAMAALPPSVRRAGLERGLKIPDVDARRFACEALASLAPGESLDGLAACAVADTSPAVREAAERALAKAPGNEAAQAVAVHLGASKPLARQVAAARTLGRMANPAAVPALLSALQRVSTPPAGLRGHVLFGRQVSYVADYDVEVAQAAAIADPQVGVLTEGAVLDATVLAVSTVRTAVLGALRSISGADHGRNPAAWRAWWERRQRESP